MAAADRGRAVQPGGLRPGLFSLGLMRRAKGWWPGDLLRRTGETVIRVGHVINDVCCVAQTVSQRGAVELVIPCLAEELGIS